MTERHRHRPDKKADKRAGKRADKKAAGAPRSRKDGVSLADRLGGSGTAGSGPTNVLPAGSKPPAVKPQSRQQQREQRALQKRKAQQRWWITLAAVLGVVAVGALAVLWLSGRGDDVRTTEQLGRTERTLAMTLAGDDAPATSGALMVYDADNTTAGSVLIPSRLFVEGPTPGGLPFGETVLLGDDAAPGSSLANTLDVIVDDTWQVSNPMLAQLVNAADGVLVDVDTDVLAGSRGGPQTIVVPAGDSQLLNGAEAVAFATYLAPDENEEARLARFSQVLDQVVQKLPDDRAGLLAVLDEVKATENSTLGTQSLADFLFGYGNLGRSGDTSYQSLPVDPLETGAPNPALIVDPAGLERLRAGLLADSLPPDAGGQQITVLVQNGVGTPLLEQDAAELLLDEGYEFSNGGNALDFGLEETVVLIPDSSEVSQALGADVANTLGVPSSAVQVTDQGSQFADVIVILGADFKP